MEIVHRLGQPRAWSVGRIVIPKRGSHSVGVERRFVPEQGRTMNSQLGVGLFLTGPAFSIPVDWRIVLADRWATDREWRAKCYVPDERFPADEVESLLSMLDAVPPRYRSLMGPLLVDLGETRCADVLVNELTRRGVSFLIRVDGGQNAVAAARLAADERGVTTLRGQGTATTVAHIARGIAHPHGCRTRQRCPQLLSASVWLAPCAGWRADHPVNRPPSPRQRLVVRCPVTTGEPPEYWVTSLPRDELRELPWLLRLLRRHHEDVALLRTDFGVLDFEGRSFPGWHHHMTLASAAFAYDRLVRRGAGAAVEGGERRSPVAATA